MQLTLDKFSGIPSHEAKLFFSPKKMHKKKCVIQVTKNMDEST